MADILTVELVTPEALLFSEAAEMVVVPGVEGDFGVLVNHAPLISVLRPGVMHIYETAGSVKDVFVAGGFAEVTGERCVILAEEAVDVSAIDAEKTAARLDKAKYQLEHAKNDRDRHHAEKEITVVEAMLAAKG